MANTIQFKRRVSGAAGAPSALKSGEVAHNEVDDTLYVGKGDDGAGNATSVVPLAGKGSFADLTSTQTIGGAKTFSTVPKSSQDASGSTDLVRKSQFDTGLATKAAATHSHAISDVTGLQTALDGKAASAHTHGISDVTGLQTALDAKAPLAFPSAAAFFASATPDASMIGKRAGTQDGLAWDIVAAGTGDFDHPVTGVGISEIGLRFNALSFGADPTGLNSSNVALARMMNATSLRSGKVTHYWPSGTYKFDFTGADVVNNPIICAQIEQDDVFVVGDGESTVFQMAGITAAQLNAGSNDPLAAGGDAATIYNWEDCARGGARNIRVTGTGGGTAITVGKARAKGFGVMNAQFIEFDRITGTDIPGNLINIRGYTGNRYTASYACSVKNSRAERCSENGFNFMGGTYDCVFALNVSLGNQYHGFESGCFYLLADGNICNGNAKTGISQVGHFGLICNNQAEANVFAGIHVQWNNSNFAGLSNTLQGNNTRGQTGVSSAGILIDKNVQGTIVNVGRIFGEVDGIKLSGVVSTDPVTGTKIDGVSIEDDGTSRLLRGINMVHADDTTITRCRIKGAVNQSILGQGAGDVALIERNIVDAPISKGTMTNTIVRENHGYRTENKGTYTVPSGATSIQIPHGLASAPTWARASFRTTALGAAGWTAQSGSTITIQAQGSAVNIPAGTIIEWEAAVL